MGNSSVKTDILSYLTDDDIRQLIESEDELSRSGSFNRVFPSLNSHDYLKYFDFVYYHNILLDSWEQKYYNNREEGLKTIFFF
jgi:tubulin polyglutamylase TTLL4